MRPDPIDTLDLQIAYADVVDEETDARLREIIDAAPPFLNRRDAAAFISDKLGLPCTKQVLEKLACVGGGPHTKSTEIGRSTARHNLSRGRAHACARHGGRRLRRTPND